ncbi:MAG: hypothetical protein FJ197_04285 [Gammaproteobacteria bacterium]|nr:hypothetical protein [Gammaproteobacteria bacterium]
MTAWMGSRWWTPFVAPAIAMLVSCAAFDSPDLYNRHRFSEITQPRDGAGGASRDVFYFDVSITAEFPDNDATAEAERMRWLDEWLELRGMCPAGREILRKRPFDFMEDNPARRDQRYEVRCRAAAAQ